MLIAVTDQGRLQVPIETWASDLFIGGIDIIQIREPDLEENALFELVKTLCVLAPSYNCIQLNGHRNIAEQIGCGLHLPEREPIVETGPHPFSRSVHSVKAAKASGSFDFVVAGHIFATPSKSGLPPRGVQWLRRIVDHAQSPVVAIGGINHTNAADIMAGGAAGIAVIGALSSCDDPRLEAAALRSILDRAWEQSTNAR